MYQIAHRGYFETEHPDELIEAIKKAVTDTNSEMIGQLEVYGLSPYVDYQKADVVDTHD